MGHWSRSFEAIPSASFVTNSDCFWTWMMGHSTCHFEAGPSAQLHSQKQIMNCCWTWVMGPWTWSFEASPSASFLVTDYYCSWTWMLGHWTCHSSIGLVTLKLGLRPSFILNEKLCLFLDLDVGRWDLSLQHWTCQFEAGPNS